MQRRRLRLACVSEMALTATPLALLLLMPVPAVDALGRLITGLARARGMNTRQRE